MQRARLVYFIICKSFKGLLTHLLAVNEETEAFCVNLEIGERPSNSRDPDLIHLATLSCF